MKKISLIVCINNNNVIGNDNDLIYHIKEDLQNFKRLTTNNVIIMGRKTYESLPTRPLQNRINIIITRDYNYNVTDENVYIVHSVEEAISLCEKEFNDIECFVIGGGQIYSEFLEKDYINRMYITKICDDSDGNIKFPLIEDNRWKLSFLLPSFLSNYLIEFKIYDRMINKN